MRRTLSAISICRRGATAIEYGLIVALLAVAAMGAFTRLGNSAAKLWNTLSTEVLTAN